MAYIDRQSDGTYTGIAKQSDDTWQQTGIYSGSGVVFFMPKEEDIVDNRWWVVTHTAPIGSFDIVAAPTVVNYDQTWGSVHQAVERVKLDMTQGEQVNEWLGELVQNGHIYLSTKKEITYQIDSKLWHFVQRRQQRWRQWLPLVAQD